MSNLSRVLLAQIKPIEEKDATLLGLRASGNLLGYILTIVNIALALIGVGAAIFIVIAGVRYITSQGDETDAKKAKNGIIYAVIGLIVVGLSAVIVNTVLRVFSSGGAAAIP